MTCKGAEAECYEGLWLAFERVLRGHTGGTECQARELYLCSGDRGQPPRALRNPSPCHPDPTVREILPLMLYLFSGTFYFKCLRIF